MLFKTVHLPLLERDTLYIQNSLAATMGKGYSLYPKQSGCHYVRGIFLYAEQSATMGKGYIFFISRTVQPPLWERDILYIQNSPAATIRKRQLLFKTVRPPLWERDILYIQNSPATTMRKGYSLYPEQSGCHYVRGILSEDAPRMPPRYIPHLLFIFYLHFV